MDPARFKRLNELFHAAHSLAPEEQRSFIQQECGSDATLRVELEAMLGYRETELDDVLSTPVRGPDSVQGQHHEPSLPVRIGRYRIIRQIGEGGIGVVYEVEQEAPRRRVALKIIRPGLSSAHLLRRFRQEADVLGQLHHPGIAQIYEAGLAEVGTPSNVVAEQPYFVMELVSGQPVSKYADANRLTTRQRLALFAGICDAVQHAHHKHVIHRDLKPSNILVDKTGQPKILDFGVARLMTAEDKLTTVGTDANHLIGTIPYMSPEQVGGDLGELDTRSDVYSLGTILYELLAGRLPLELANKSIPESARIIRDEEPTPLSGVNRIFRGDIETIVGKALEKDRERRCDAASEMAADIRRYLADEPIAARPPTTFYHLRKFARRNKRLVGVAAAAVLALMIGVLGTTVGLLRALDSERHGRQQTYRACIAAAAEALRDDDAVAARRYLTTAPCEHRNWEWYHFLSRTDTSRLVLRGHAEAVTCLAFGPEGQVLATGSLDGTVRFWNPHAGREIAEALTHSSGVRSVAFSPDGTLVASGCSDGTLRVWDWRQGSVVADLHGHEDAVRSVAFDLLDDRILTASDDKTLRLWSLDQSDSSIVALHEDRVTSVAFRVGSNEIVSATSNGFVYVWNGSGSQLLRKAERHPHSINGVALAHDGSMLASASRWACHVGGRHRSRIACITTIPTTSGPTKSP